MMSLGKIPRRVIIDKVLPQIDGGRYAAKRFLGESVEVSTVLLIDGHDQVKGRLLYRHESEKSFQQIFLKSSPGDRGNDVWRGKFKASKLGRYYVSVEADIDHFETWRSDIQKKREAGQDISVDLEIGIQLIQHLENLSKQNERTVLHEALQKLRHFREKSTDQPLPFLDEPELRLAALHVFDEKTMVRYGHEIPLQIEPSLAQFSSWYEFFPRSVGGLRAAEARLKPIKEMGFNIVYLPPIHPIGSSFRKGRNNQVNALENDVGSPWAIGSEEGGHKSIHPELGSFRDFDRFLHTAHALGLEVAMDLAFQCSPDHPYVTEHPEWFKKRPDGSIRYAENPPKKYQDIYPFDFESKAWQSLWEELKSVVQFWIKQGVRIFRVDNPHTKPFAFWEWLIREIKISHPEVIFLSEAFTRPQVMAYLAKCGFTQSYTYFSWRNTKWEITRYMSELTKTELIDYFGANFWPNTPDILPHSLQKHSRGIYLQRLILAATLSSNYGIYGPAFELMEHEPLRIGGEEYLHSEKYELKNWDLKKPDSLEPVIQKINHIRNNSKALQQNRSLEFHPVSNEFLIAYSKSCEDERIIVIVNLDPERVQSGMIELPLKEWEIDPSKNFQVEDLLTNTSYFWMGWRNYVELRPQELPAHILRLRAIS